MGRGNLIDLVTVRSQSLGEIKYTNNYLEVMIDNYLKDLP